MHLYVVQNILLQTISIKLVNEFGWIAEENRVSFS
jgi:hypothetical protein